MIRPLLARALVGANRVRRRSRGPLRPTWSVELEAWTRLLHHYSRQSHWVPLAMQRRMVEAMAPARPPAGVSEERVTVGGRPAAWIVPDGGDATRAILYLHGGGYGIGSIASHRHFVSRLAREAGMAALLVDYRLAPEHPFPAALDDARASWRWLLDRGLDAQRMVVGGESAGGGLTMATLLALRDAGEALPAAAFVLSPWVDLTLGGATIESNDRFDYIPRRALQRYARAYAGREPFDHPLVSPAHADLAGLPRLLIQAGGAETLLDDARLLHRRAEAAGVDAHLTVYPDMVHAFMLLQGMPGAREAIAEITATIDEALEPVAAAVGAR